MQKMRSSQFFEIFRQLVEILDTGSNTRLVHYRRKCPQAQKLLFKGLGEPAQVRVYP